MAVPLRSLLTAAALGLMLAASTGCGDGGNNSSTNSSSTGTGAGGQGAGGGGSGGSPPAGPLSVMTWNIENFPQQGDTIQRVRDIILQQQPDVLAIQEIEDPQSFDDLAQLLPEYDAELNSDDGQNPLYLGFLYKRDRVQLSEVATLYTGNWYPFPRPPLKARVTADGGAYDFILVSVHLKAQLDPESQDRRREACETLNMWVNNQIDSGVDTEFMIVGDYNDELTDPASDNVFSVFLDQPDSYTFLTQPAANDNEYTFIPFQSMIDHVLITNTMLDEYGAGFTNILPFDVSIEDYNQVSDHRPVFVRLVKE